MVSQRITTKVVLLQDSELLCYIGRIFCSLLHIHVITPTGNLHTVIAHLTDSLAHCLKRKVSPLTSKNRYHPCHGVFSLFCVIR